MTMDDVLRELGTIGNGLPRAAMCWALDHWEEAGPRLLALLTEYADGTDTSERSEQALFMAAHLLAEKRETAAFAPLCRLLADREAADLVLGDAITETLSSLLISTFDGNVAALRAVIEQEAADDFVRNATLAALAFLTRTGTQTDEEMRAYLRHLLSAMRPQAEHLVWVGWVTAVALLGYRDLVGEVEALFRRGFVPDDVMGLKHFQKDLQLTLGDPAGLAGFHKHRVGPFTSAVGEFETWYGFSEKDARADPALAAPTLAAPAWPKPVTNPLRHVGRNDPCPCGSGKKYKKCCLAA